jgi:hypothetical protein
MPQISMLEDAEILDLAPLLSHLGIGVPEVWILDVPEHRLGSTKFQVRTACHELGLEQPEIVVDRYAGGCDLCVRGATTNAWPMVRLARFVSRWIRERIRGS